MKTALLIIVCLAVAVFGAWDTARYRHNAKRSPHVRRP